MTSTNLTPGHVASLCPGCARRLPDLSHPSPCTTIRWREGFAGRHVPNLVVEGDGVVCSDHQALAPAPATWQPVAPTPTRGIGSS